MNDDDKEIQQITKNYSEIVRTHPAADSQGELRSKIKDLTTRWETLINTVQETLKNVRLDQLDSVRLDLFSFSFRR